MDVLNEGCIGETGSWLQSIHHPFRGFADGSPDNFNKYGHRPEIITVK